MTPWSPVQNAERRGRKLFTQSFTLGEQSGKANPLSLQEIRFAPPPDPPPSPSTDSVGGSGGVASRILVRVWEQLDWTVGGRMEQRKQKGRAN